jgi:hypothetical protein
LLTYKYISRLRHGSKVNRQAADSGLLSAAKKPKAET